MSRIFEIKQNSELLKKIKNKTIEEEDVFRNYLCENCSDLLPVYDMEGEEEYKLLYLGKEGETEHGPLDALFIDKYGILTLLEVKRIADSRTRREVVTQALDYASGLSRKSIEDIILMCSKLEKGLQDKNNENLLFDFAKYTLKKLYETRNNNDAEIPEFAQKIKSNLKNHYIRILIVAEEIPQTLVDLAHFTMQGNPPFRLGLGEISIEEIGEKKYFIPHIKFSSSRFPAEAYHFSPKYETARTKWNIAQVCEELAKNRDWLENLAKLLQIDKEESIINLSSGSGKTATLGLKVKKPFFSGVKYCSVGFVEKEGIKLNLIYYNEKFYNNIIELLEKHEISNFKDIKEEFENKIWKADSADRHQIWKNFVKGKLGDTHYASDWFFIEEPGEKFLKDLIEVIFEYDKK